MRCTFCEGVVSALTQRPQSQMPKGCLIDTSFKAAPCQGNMLKSREELMEKKKNLAESQECMKGV